MIISHTDELYLDIQTTTRVQLYPDHQKQCHQKSDLLIKLSYLKYDCLIKNGSIYNLVFSSTHELHFIMVLLKYIDSCYDNTNKSFFWVTMLKITQCGNSHPGLWPIFFLKPPILKRPIASSHICTS